ncbi:MAG: RNA 2',3'-cyclic phosphodiesterase [Phycisphaerales bacterium]
MSRSLRLFVAVYPPLASAEALLELAAGVCAPVHRAVAPRDVHLTLLFIGDTPQRETRSLIESVERAAAGISPFRLTPRELATLPCDRPPRLLAAMTDSPSPLLELQRRLARRLARSGARRESFNPHLTLVRFARHAPSPGPCTIPIDPAGPSGAPFLIERLAVMSSRPPGAGSPPGSGYVHEPLAWIDLRSG